MAKSAKVRVGIYCRGVTHPPEEINHETLEKRYTVVLQVVIHSLPVEKWIKIATLLRKQGMSFGKLRLSSWRVVRGLVLV